MALPSRGSVPLPSSSRRTRDLPSALFRARAIFFMRLEKVERDSSIDCSSPMSAKIELNIGSLVPSSAGSGNPA